MQPLLKAALLGVFVFCVQSQLAMADLVWGTVTHTAPISQSGTYAVFFNPGTGGTLLGDGTYAIQGATSVGANVTIATDSSDSRGIDHLYANTASQLLSNPVGSDDSSLDDLSLALAGRPFNTLYLNLFGAFKFNHSGGANDSVTFVVTTTEGTFTHVFSGLTSDNTNNWIVLSARAGEHITSVSLEDTRFYALESLYLSGVAPLVTPEPASLGLLVSGLLGTLCLRRRKR